MKVSLPIVDVSLPCYWYSDRQRPHVSIPVWRGMTVKQVRDALEREVTCGFVMGTGKDAQLLSADYIADAADVIRADMLTVAVYKAIQSLKSSDLFGSRNGRCFQNLEKQTDDEYGDSVMAYFMIDVESERYETQTRETAQAGT